MDLAKFKEEMEREIASLHTAVSELRALLPDLDIDKLCGVRSRFSLARMNELPWTCALALPDVLAETRPQSAPLRSDGAAEGHPGRLASSTFFHIFSMLLTLTDDVAVVFLLHLQAREERLRAMREIQSRFLVLCEELRWRNEAEVADRNHKADGEDDEESNGVEFGGRREDEGRLLPADFFLPAEHDLSEARLARFKGKVAEGDKELVCVVNSALQENPHL